MTEEGVGMTEEGVGMAEEDWGLQKNHCNNRISVSVGI